MHKCIEEFIAWWESACVDDIFICCYKGYLEGQHRPAERLPAIIRRSATILITPNPTHHHEIE